MFNEKNRKLHHVNNENSYHMLIKIFKWKPNYFTHSHMLHKAIPRITATPAKDHAQWRVWCIYTNVLDKKRMCYKLTESIWDQKWKLSFKNCSQKREKFIYKTKVLVKYQSVTEKNNQFSVKIYLRGEKSGGISDERRERRECSWAWASQYHFHSHSISLVFFRSTHK